MALSNVIEKLGKAIFETPFGASRIAKDAPELAEIRIFVLDAIKEKSHRVGGKQVFAHNLIRIHLLGVSEEQSGAFQSEFPIAYFADEIKSALARSGYRFPADLRVEISTTSKLPASGEGWLSIEVGTSRVKPAEASARGRRPAKLVVTHGTADQPHVVLEKARTNIGRSSEVFRGSGPSRRNDLAFAENSEINRTVSREHAHILYSRKTGEYRLFNDRWYKAEENCGLWIVRDGLSRAVHRGARGAVLKPGDEIHLGSAVVSFQGK